MEEITTMKIKSKSGIEVEIELSGTQEDPTIIAKPFEVQGRKVSGSAMIQHWKHKGAEEGLFFQNGDAYLQCANEMTKIREAITQLPHKKYIAQKVSKEINSDGYIINTTEWKFGCMPMTEKGTIVTETEMGRFLDAKGITQIEMHEAMKLWADEKEEAHIKANVEGKKRAKAIFDDDESDQGYDQACENANIPKFLR